MIIRPCGETSPHRAHLDVSESTPARLAFQPAGLEMILPNAFLLTVSGSKEMCVGRVGGIHRTLQRARLLRQGDEVDAIVHQAIALKRQAVALAGLPQQMKIDKPVTILAKDSAPARRQLHDMPDSAGRRGT